MDSTGRNRYRSTIASLLAMLAMLWLPLLAAAPGGATYTYDNLGRLTSVTYDDGTIQGYAYDSAGNRLQTQSSAVGGVLQFAQSAYSLAEQNGNVTLSVSRVGPSTGAVLVQYATSDATATAGADYSSSAGTLTWSAGDTTAKAISVPVLDDGLGEAPETFLVMLTAPGGGAGLGTPAQATVTIIDNETIGFAIADVSVSEGVSGATATIVVAKSGTATLTHAVNYATGNGTAVAGSDYTAATGTLSFAPGEASKSISVPIVDDSVFEGAEAFAIALSAPTNGAVIGVGTANVSIAENDPAPAFSVADVTVSESASSVSFSVTKSNDTALTHAVNYSTAGGSATAGMDFTTTAGTLSFAPNETSKSITVPLLGDTTYEGNETFTLSLSAATNEASIARITATATITEDDPQPQPGTLRFSVASVAAAETSASASILVSRVDGSAGPASVRCGTSDGSAFAGSDYTAVSVTLSWADGDAADKACTVPLLNDSVFEEPETINLTLSNVVGAALGTPATAVINLSSEDPAPVGTLQFTANTASVNENGTTLTLTVARVSGSYGAASAVCSTSNGSAIAGSDYTAIAQTVSWPAGDASNRTCAVSIIDDSIYGGNKTFTIALGSISGANLGTPDSAIVTIMENEASPSFSIADISVMENAGTATFTVTKSGATELWHEVAYATSDGSGTSSVDVDFVAVSGSLFFAAGDTAKTVTITIIDAGAAHYEGNEWFALNLSSPTGGASLARAAGICTIIENDTPPTIYASSVSVTEGSPLQFTLSMPAITDLPHSVSYATADGTATAPADYQAVSGTVTFLPGENLKSVTVPTVDDASLESAVETMTLVLGNPTNGALASSPGTGSISDNDNTFPSVPLNLRTTETGAGAGNYMAVWDASSGAVSYYQLERDQETSFTAPNYNLYTITAPAVSQAFAIPNQNITFYFRARACNASNQCSGWSNIASASFVRNGGG